MSLRDLAESYKSMGGVMPIERQIAAAPDLALLVADMADFFDEQTMHTHSPAALLARFRELEKQAEL